jgi:transposase-like protein
VTAGTIFEHTKTPLTVWFEVAWQMATNKSGVSAKHLHRLLPVASYPTVWAMLARLRTVMGQDGALLGESGRIVEIDETFLGGPRPGKRGRGADGKTMVVGAVEVNGRRLGRARLAVVPDASADTLHGFITARIVAGTTVRTDGLTSYLTATKGFVHDPINVRASGHPAHEVLPGTHRLFSQLKRWLDGLYQGGVQDSHLSAYLDEFIFRFNRRSSLKRGMVFYRLLQRGVDGAPVTFADLIVNPAPKDMPPEPPTGARPSPTSLDVARADRPWLHAPPLPPTPQPHTTSPNTQPVATF